VVALLTSAAGLTGAAALGYSFGVLPSPPPLAAPPAAPTRYAASHRQAMLAAARLEARQRHSRLFCVSRIQQTRNRCNAPSRRSGALFSAALDSALSRTVT
jgi:hypothetical protein